MDFVPKKARSRYNALDSVTRFGWSGSAVLGPSVAGIAGVAAESKGEDKGGGVEVGDTLLVDVQGALPHGISYLSRFGK